ncbi:MAG TPA: DUF1015 family protein [Syntrophales bacterium]|nr:DUF1015 family protein [Syntrophales bacterium]
MSIVLPFGALRPQKQFVEAVAAYPYDVVNEEEAKNIVRDNPLSFLRVEKSEVDIPGPYNAHEDRIYEIAGENLHRMMRENILCQDKTPYFYIYRQRMNSHEQYGIVARVDLAEYESGRIKKHELTTVDKEVDRIKHVLTINAQTGPVFLTYPSQEAIDGLVKKIIESDPEYDFTADDGISHTVWVIRNEKDIAAITSSFTKVDTLYIADGHHRAAAAAAVRRLKRAQNPFARGDEAYNFVMAVLFPHNQLKILGYNRVVRDLNGLNEVDFLRKVGEQFFVSENFAEKSPGQYHEIGMYLHGRWFKIEPKDGSYDRDDPVCVLDVSILQDNLLKPILGIQNPRTDGRIKYIGGIRGVKELERLVDSNEFAVAFALYPTTMEQLMAVSDTGKIMPPKSTWFEPKLRSGIFVHLLTS